MIPMVLLAAAMLGQDPVALVREGDEAYVAKDYAKAAQLYIQAIKLDPESPDLYDRLGRAYQAQHNQRFTLAFKKAEELRAKRAAAPAPAQLPAGALDAAKAAHARGDYAAALQLFQPLAGQGNATAQFALGLMSEEGQGMAADPAQAARWYEQAAAQKHPQALANLGYLYSEGKGVPKDAVRARQFYEQAAGLGIASAMYSLGSMYYAGEGGTKDIVDAYVWWRRAADKKHAKAAANVAVLEKKLSAAQLRAARQKLAE